MDNSGLEFLTQFQKYSSGYLASRTVKIEAAQIDASDLVLHVMHGATPYRFVIVDHRNWGDFGTVRLVDNPADLASYIISYLDEEIETGLLDHAIERDGVKEVLLRDGD